MVKKFFVLIILLSSAAVSQSIKVKAFTDTTDYFVGDYIKYTISVEHGKNVSVSKPVLKDTSLKLELISSSEPVQKEENDKTITEFQFVLSGYDSLQATIPSFPIRYKQNSNGKILSGNDTTLPFVSTAPVQVNVHTLKVDTQQEIKDVKEPLTIPLDWKIVLLWVLIVVLLLVAAYYIYKKYFKNRKKPAVPFQKKIVIPADIEAFASLDNLEKKQLWQQGLVKEYHSEITEIIRLYFEKRFELPALELTTSEVDTQLRQHPSASNIIELTYEFLSNADLVKFAKYQPAFNVNEEMMKQAREIVARTRPGKTVEAGNVQ